MRSLEPRQLVDHRPDAREVGVAGVRRRSVDADEEELGAVRHLGRVEREGEPVAVSLQQLGDVLLVERHLARAQRIDLLGHDVADHDLVTEVGQAGARDQADPPGAEDSDLASSRKLTDQTLFDGPQALRDRDHRLVRELVEQRVHDPVGTCPPSRRTTMCSFEPE